MSAYTLEQFQDRTGLLPHIIAGVVSSDDEAFIDKAEARTLSLYNRNARWRRLMHRKSSREWLYAFMHHWHDAHKAGNFHDIGRFA